MEAEWGPNVGFGGTSGFMEGVRFSPSLGRELYGAVMLDLLDTVTACVWDWPALTSMESTLCGAGGGFSPLLKLWFLERWEELEELVL